ncbi:MAG: phenylalanine--tRNA ligase subunit beta [Methanobacteriota archaeon]
MPTVEFVTEDLLNLLGGKDLSLTELEESIPMIGVSLEEIDEEKVVLEVFPNRPDMLSIEGFVRAFKGFFGLEKGFIDYEVLKSDITLYVDPSVEKIRPFVCAAQIDGVKIHDFGLRSLMNVQEKLHITHGRNRVKVAIGVHDSDKLTPPYTYKAVKPDSISFIPLDTQDEMNLIEILEKHPKGVDYAFTLEWAEKYPIIVDSQQNVLSFPPIINGELTKITEETKNLFIEVTGKSQLAIDQALNIVVTSIADRGGKIKSVEIKHKKNKNKGATSTLLN